MTLPVLVALWACGPKEAPPPAAVTTALAEAPPAAVACPADGEAPADVAAFVAELDARATRDQEVRAAKPVDEAAMSAVDAENRAWLRGIVARHGFPSAAVYGADAVSDAWLLLQHGDLDLQRACLPVIRDRVAAGEVKGAAYALLHDRVLVRSGEPQVYGTQFREVEGTQAPCPVADLEGVDARRAELGLEPLADYAAKMAQVYETPATATPLPSCE